MVNNKSTFPSKLSTISSDVQLLSEYIFLHMAGRSVSTILQFPQ